MNRYLIMMNVACLGFLAWLNSFVGGWDAVSSAIFTVNVVLGLLLIADSINKFADRYLQYLSNTNNTKIN